MVKKVRRLLLAAVALLAAVGFCEETETVKVRGRGIGISKMEALKDAYRDAVEQAVGLYVDAEQMVKNEDLVKDQILTQSNAYIEKYEIAKEHASENGLVSVTILADVRKRALSKKITDVMPSQKVKLSDVSKNLHAQIVTDLKANDDALSIVKNELKDLSPLKQLMKTSLVTVKPVVEPVKEDPSLVRLWYPIKIEVDADKYYKEFAPRWARILDQIKIAPAKRLDLRNNPTYAKAYSNTIAKRYGTTRKNSYGVMTRCDETYDDTLCRWGLALNQEYWGMGFLDTRILGKNYVLHGFGWKSLRFDDGLRDDTYEEKNRLVERVFPQGETSHGLQCQISGDCVFCIGLITAARGQTLSGSLYKIPQDCIDEIVEWQHKTACGKNEEHNYRETAPEVDFVLHFADANGDEIIGQTVSFRNLEIMNFGCVLLEDTEYRNSSSVGGKRLWLISPLVGGFAMSFVKWVNIDVPKDDVAKIATASISVEE